MDFLSSDTVQTTFPISPHPRALDPVSPHPYSNIPRTKDGMPMCFADRLLMGSFSPQNGVISGNLTGLLIVSQELDEMT